MNIGSDLVAFSDFGGIGLIATDPDTVTDINVNVIEDLNDLSPEQAGVLSEIISDVVYYSRPVGEFLLGALYGTAANNLGEAFEIGQFFLPFKLTERDRRYWTQVINSQSTAFKLGIEVANAGSIVQGIIEIISGGGTFLGGAALCTVGAGATFGISCAAGAPAMVAGAAVLAHGSSLIKNGLENDTDANLIDDLLAPQKMASTGGADGADGLAKKLGVDRKIVDETLEVLGTKQIEQLQNKLVYTEKFSRRNELGEIVEGTRRVDLFKPLLKKLDGIENTPNGNQIKDEFKKLIYNVNTAISKADNDVDAINDIRETLRLNRTKADGTQTINDIQLKQSFSEYTSFLDNYGKRVSGAFSHTFGRASAIDVNQARGEINLAEDLLDSKAFLNNNGSGQSFLGQIDNVKALSDLRKYGGNPKIPDYLITNSNNVSRLVEIKTPTKKLRADRLRRSLGEATIQIRDNAPVSNSTNKGIVRLDYRSNDLPADLSTFEIEAIVQKRMNDFFNIEKTIKGSDLIDFVEVIYKDANNSNIVQTVVVKIN